MSADLVALAPAHAGVMAALHHICFSDPWSEKAMAALLTLPGIFGWLATEDRPEGFVLARIAADEAEILTILVLPPYRRHGLAERLLQAAADEARRLGAAKLFLEVAANNAAALGLYTKGGFQRTGLRPRYYGNSTDAVLMSVAL